MTDKKEERYAYSYDNEVYHGSFTTEEYALEEAINDSDDEEVFYIGVAEGIKPENYFDVESFIEDMDENMCCNTGADDRILDVDNEKELGKIITDAIKKHCSCRWYTVNSYNIYDRAKNHLPPDNPPKGFTP